MAAVLEYADWIGPKPIATEDHTIHEVFGDHRANWLLILRALPEPDDWSLRCDEPISKGPVMISNAEMVVGKKLRELCLRWRSEFDTEDTRGLNHNI